MINAKYKIKNWKYIMSMSIQRGACKLELSDIKRHLFINSYSPNL